MASFTNRKGEVVEVSEEFIDTAIELKIELQKESPSGRCSYARLKKMMHEEGFTEADSNESMRQMIKREQKKRGELPAVEKYADMVSDKKLESVKSAIGEMYVAKRGAQNANRELNRLKRYMSDDLFVLEAVQDALKDKDFNYNIELKPLVKDDNSKTVIAFISDVHYGAVVDVEGRTYDTDMAEDLLLGYAEKLLNIARENKAEHVYVVGLGDYFEHSNMRAQNTFDVEKMFDEQIVDLSDILIEFLSILATEFTVTYSAISGNHDRLNGNFKDQLYAESGVRMSNKIVQTFIKYNEKIGDRIEYIEPEPYHHTLEVDNKNFLFMHGDRIPMSKDTVLAEQSSLHGIDFDVMVGGHIHKHTVKEVGDDKYVVTFGSIKGTDAFSLKKLGVASSRSQGVILVDEEGFEIKQVKL